MRLGTQNIRDRGSLVALVALVGPWLIAGINISVKLVRGGLGHWHGNGQHRGFHRALALGMGLGVRKYEGRGYRMPARLHATRPPTPPPFLQLTRPAAWYLAMADMGIV